MTVIVDTCEVTLLTAEAVCVLLPGAWRASRNC